MHATVYKINESGSCIRHSTLSLHNQKSFCEACNLPFGFRHDVDASGERMYLIRGCCVDSYVFMIFSSCVKQKGNSQRDEEKGKL